jgi:hypothetical protein
MYASCTTVETPDLVNISALLLCFQGSEDEPFAASFESNPSMSLKTSFIPKYAIEIVELNI